MAHPAEFQTVFAQLKAILEPYAPRLVVTADSDHAYSLYTAHVMPNKQPLFFGATQIQKNYVSFYLMPVYGCPDLLDGISPELKKHMQGKSCFNFKAVDERLFKELAKLTKAGFARFRSAKYV